MFSYLRDIRPYLFRQAALLENPKGEVSVPKIEGRVRLTLKAMGYSDIVLTQFDTDDLIRDLESYGYIPTWPVAEGLGI